jgi:hypothetical protein
MLASCSFDSSGSALGPNVIEDECGDEESKKDSNDTIGDVFAIVYPSFANSRSPRTERTVCVKLP